MHETARRHGLPARTRTWNHRLGGGSYILFNYGERNGSVPQLFLGVASHVRE
jgi:hypothetical protein